MATTEGPPSMLTLRIGLRLLTGSGVAAHSDLLALVQEYEPGAAWSGDALAAALNKQTWALRDAEVIVRRGERWYARNVADLAAWIADGYAEREDAGFAQNPRVPAKKAPAGRGGDPAAEERAA